MVNHSLTDIDSLCLAVRDIESRRLISEAMTAYAAWCVSLSDRVDMDPGGLEIIVKARGLAAPGEAAPHAFVAELDASW